MSLQDPAPRPPARLVLTTPEHLLAFGFGAGLSPVAPGTMGTLVAVPLWLLLSLLPLPLYALALLLLVLAGIRICGDSARLLGMPDYPGIVFDEIAGFCVAATPLLFFPTWPPWAGLGATFVLFRIFDVLKPGPIGWSNDHIHGGFGIMADDLIAGLCAGAIMTLALRIA